jgi:glycosyltransferase involved in cell wall biosynthesis
MSAQRISTITPVRDGELYIGEAIDSILTQTRPPDQVIVVDDGSDDGTAARVDAYGDSVTLLRRDPEGVGAAVNAGVDAADGELIAFLDADDLWTPNKLEIQCEAMAADPALDMVFGRVEQFLSPELSDAERARLQVVPGAQPAKLKGTMLIRRDAFDRVGGFTTDLPVAEFVEWYPRAQEQGLTELMLDDVLLRRRLHHSNLGRNRSGDRREYASAIGAMLRRRRKS